jgi:hypothetical protein
MKYFVNLQRAHPQSNKKEIEELESNNGLSDERKCLSVLTAPWNIESSVSILPL